MRKKPKSCPHKNICKVDNATFHGYKLGIQRQGVLFKRYFSTRQHGSWEAAEAAAVAERDRVLELIKDISTEQMLILANKYNNRKA